MVAWSGFVPDQAVAVTGRGKTRGRLGMMNGRTLSFDGGIPVKGAARVEAAGAMRIADAARV